MRCHVLVALVAPGLGCGILFDWKPTADELPGTTSGTSGPDETSEPTSGTESSPTTMTTRVETTDASTSTTSVGSTTGPDATSETTAEQTDTSGSTGALCPNGSCDPGEDNASCPDDCPPVCPNGVMEAGEECDDGDMDDSDECVDGCKLATCGDGFVRDGTEECDDGNAVDDDACRTDCMLPRRRVFATSMAFNGNLGGLVGADAKCNAAAEAAQLSPPGAFKAWLSDLSGSPAVRFNASLANFAGLYVLVDGTTKIADGWADLVDEDLDHPIDQDEAGLATRGFDVWSNTEPSGNLLFANKHCTNWIISMGGTNKGGIGSSAAMSDQWSASGEATCSTPLHLYCFED